MIQKIYENVEAALKIIAEAQVDLLNGLYLNEKKITEGMNILDNSRTWVLHETLTKAHKEMLSAWIISAQISQGD